MNLFLAPDWKHAFSILPVFDKDIRYDSCCKVSDLLAVVVVKVTVNVKVVVVVVKMVVVIVKVVVIDNDNIDFDIGDDDDDLSPLLVL